MKKYAKSMINIRRRTKKNAREIYRQENIGIVMRLKADKQEWNSYWEEF